MLRDVEVLAGLVSEAKARSSRQHRLSQDLPGRRPVDGRREQRQGLPHDLAPRRDLRRGRRLSAERRQRRRPDQARREAVGILLEPEDHRRIDAARRGKSRIEELFLAGDRRRYYVPCPHCGHMDFLRFSEREVRDDEDAAIDGGHIMQWPKIAQRKRSSSVRNAAATSKRSTSDDDRGRRMARRRRVRAATLRFTSGRPIRSARTRAGGTSRPSSSRRRRRPDKLRTFVNTVLGETWKEKGEAPDWERLYERREAVQDRHGPRRRDRPDDRRRRSTGPIRLRDRRLDEDLRSVLDRGEGDPVGRHRGRSDMGSARRAPGRDVHERDRRRLPIANDGDRLWLSTQMAFTTGDASPADARDRDEGRRGARMLVGLPTKVEVTVRGKKLKRGAGLAGRRRHREDRALRLASPSRKTANRRRVLSLPRIRRRLLPAAHRRRARDVERPEDEGDERCPGTSLPNRENHFLDCRVYARVAAAVLGIDRMPKREEEGDQRRRAAAVDRRPRHQARNLDAPSSPPRRSRRRRRSRRTIDFFRQPRPRLFSRRR
jgi:hypothetical protein